MPGTSGNFPGGVGGTGGSDFTECTFCSNDGQFIQSNVCTGKSPTHHQTAFQPPAPQPQLLTPATWPTETNAWAPLRLLSLQWLLPIPQPRISQIWGLIIYMFDSPPSEEVLCREDQEPCLSACQFREPGPDWK